MLMSLCAVTVSWAVPSETLGTLFPKPVPLIVISVPGAFSVTLKTIGKIDSCAIRIAGDAKSKKIRKDLRGNMAN
jgi:hypothetical protein